MKSAKAMANYTFNEILQYFSAKLKTKPPESDLEKKEVELNIDQFHVIISEGKREGTLHLYLTLGLMLQPIREERLKELVTSNFLGINTGGCSLAFDESGLSLSLHCHTTPGTSPQENWEWLHRLLCVGREWNKFLALWDEFVPLNFPREEKTDELGTATDRTYKA